MILKARKKCSPLMYFQSKIPQLKWGNFLLSENLFLKVDSFRYYIYMKINLLFITNKRILKDYLE